MSVLMTVYIVFTLNLVYSVEITKDGALKQENVDPKNSAPEDGPKAKEDVSKDTADSIQTGETIISGVGYQPVVGGGGYIPPQILFDYGRLGSFNPYPYFKGLQTYPLPVNAYYPRSQYYQPNYLENYDRQFRLYVK